MPMRDGQSNKPTARKESDKEFWEREYGHALNDEDVAEIRNNLFALHDFLVELSQKDSSRQ